MNKTAQLLSIIDDKILEYKTDFEKLEARTKDLKQFDCHFKDIKERLDKQVNVRSLSLYFHLVLSGL